MEGQNKKKKIVKSKFNKRVDKKRQRRHAIWGQSKGQIKHRMWQIAPTVDPSSRCNYIDNYINIKA